MATWDAVVSPGGVAPSTIFKRPSGCRQAVPTVCCSVPLTVAVAVYSRQYSLGAAAAVVGTATAAGGAGSTTVQDAVRASNRSGRSFVRIEDHLSAEP